MLLHILTYFIIRQHWLQSRVHDFSDTWYYKLATPGAGTLPLFKCWLIDIKDTVLHFWYGNIIWTFTKSWPLLLLSTSTIPSPSSFTFLIWSTIGSSKLDNQHLARLSNTWYSTRCPITQSEDSLYSTWLSQTVLVISGSCTRLASDSKDVRDKQFFVV